MNAQPAFRFHGGRLAYHGPSPIIFHVVLALWFSRPIDGATPHEVHVRDRAHGLIVWAVAVVIGTALATFSLSSAITTLSLSSAVKGGTDLAKSGASAIASSVGLSADPIGYEVDPLFRTDGNAAASRSNSAVDARRSNLDRHSSGVNRSLAADSEAAFAPPLCQPAHIGKPSFFMRTQVISSVQAPAFFRVSNVG